MKQRHPAILTAIPVAFPELVRVRVQVLDEERKCVVQERDWTPLLPWSRIERLPMQPRTREESEQLLREGRNASLGVHLIDIDLDESLNAALEFAFKEAIPVHGTRTRLTAGDGNGAARSGIPH